MTCREEKEKDESMARSVAVFVGSLRKESYSRKMAKALIELAPKSLHLEIVEIGRLPTYNQDFDDSGDPPGEYIAFRQRVGAADAVLFVTPEYNRSVPAVLKNAIDVASRPYGQNMWDGKPGAIVSISRGAIGGFGANHHLRQALVFVNVPTMPQPEAYVGGVTGLFDSSGYLTNESTRDFLRKFMRAFAEWVETNARAPER
jgi:chromate reductase